VKCFSWETKFFGKLQAGPAYPVTKDEKFAHKLAVLDKAMNTKSFLLMFSFASFAMVCDAQSVFGDNASLQNDAYQDYLSCVRDYAKPYLSSSNALPQDVAAAAISACEERYQKLRITTYRLFGDTDNTVRVLRESRQIARAYVVRMVLESSLQR
jgi:hypothetical protein